MTRITPRWLLRLLPWAAVEAGTYRVNRVDFRGDALRKIDARLGDDDQIILQPENLRAIPMLRHGDDELLTQLAGMLEVRQVNPGSTVISAGDAPDEFYIVIRGRLEVWTTSPEGLRVSIGVLRAGDYFGDTAIVEDRPHWSTVEAITPVTLVALSKAESQWALDDPEFRERLRAATPHSQDNHYFQSMIADPHGEPIITPSFIDYENHPREYALSTIQTTLRVHTRVMDLYASPMDQLAEQQRLTLEAMRERQEWEILNNPSYGLLNNVVDSMRIPSRSGPPTPDAFDELISRVWKEPAFFVAHPRTIAAFGRECTSRGVPPPTVTFFGSSFMTWRGIPIIPVDKMPLEEKDGDVRSDVLLMRVGEERQGVVGLHQPSIGDTGVPSLAIRANGVNQRGVAEYLMSLYFSVAVLTEDAIGVLEDVEVSRYHDYEQR